MRIEGDQAGISSMLAGEEAVIQATFLHLPGVGRATEQRLWEAGFCSWDQLRVAVKAGLSPRRLAFGARQKSLFPLEEDACVDPRARAWLRCLDASATALSEGDYGFFLERLNPGDHWRLLDTVLPEALYLDIETTGLSSDLHYITVVGALRAGRFYQWVWPEPLDELADLIRSAPVVVTFNGRRFDIPFLLQKFPVVPFPKAHIDLLYISRAAGLKGGQKSVEEQLGFTRPEGLRGFDGAEAVASWCSALYGDRRSYRQLLDYNHADVEMLPQLANKLCDKLSRDTRSMPRRTQPPNISNGRAGHKAPSFAALRRAWRERRPGLHLLERKLIEQIGHMPVVVGIDLRAKPTNPTGWAICAGAKTLTKVVFTDEEILELTLRARPDLVSIDAPLSLPKGRTTVDDDSPCRAIGGIVRVAERILWSRGIRVYPALIRQMQGLTRRGIELTRRLEAEGIQVIESYPGAAQDILNIPRKRLDENLLRQGLIQFGYCIRGAKSHDELDAITSALVGQFYLADQYEPIGHADEGFMIVPRPASMAWNKSQPHACPASSH